MYVFDSDVLSNIRKPSPSPGLIARLAVVPSEEQFTSAITVGEMVYGTFRSARRDHFLRQLEEKVWANVRVLPFDRNADETHGRLRAVLEQPGATVGEPDLRIAAIALVHDLAVVTGNVRHFVRVPDLRAENWLAPS